MADDYTDPKNSFTLTDFSVLEHLAIREIGDKSFGLVGLPLII